MARPIGFFVPCRVEHALGPGASRLPERGGREPLQGADIHWSCERGMQRASGLGSATPFVTFSPIIFPLPRFHSLSTGQKSDSPLRDKVRQVPRKRRLPITNGRDSRYLASN
jgi:hypothetical protein